MNLKPAWEKGAARLREAGVPDASLDAWYLLEYVTGIGRTEYLAHPEYTMTGEQEDAYTRLIEKRSSRIPLQHLTGVQEFMGLVFESYDDVMIVV